MNFFVFRTLVFLFVFFSLEGKQQDIYQPTERFLQQVPIDQVAQKLPSQEALPFLLSISDQEAQGGFFAYHGSSQAFRIFQDIIRAVLEEKLDYALPHDFYFMRLPGDPKFDKHTGKEEFLALFDRKNQNKKMQEAVITLFLLQPLQESLNISIDFNELTPFDRNVLMNIFDKAADRIAEQAAGVSQKEMLDILERMDVASVDLQALDVDSVLEIVSGVLQLHQIECDEASLRGWLGRHLVVYNLLKEVYRLPPQEFGRIAPYFFSLWDVKPELKERLIALNIPLFGNYARWDESTLTIVMNNQTIEKGDSAVIAILAKWFAEIGLPEEAASDLFKAAEKHIPQHSKGVLYQFFDMGPEPYRYVDANAYASYPFGVLVKDADPSELVKGEKPIDYSALAYGVLQKQLRLIASNETTLNPFSHLRIVRYDFLGDQVADALMADLRGQLSKIKADRSKLNAYKAKLDELWLAE